MAYNEKLANRVREALAHLPKVKEKMMFRGVTFMVNGKMCISVGDDELMCRISKEKNDEALERLGCRQMVHGGKPMKGFVFVSEEGYKSKKAFDYWVKLAMDFNKVAKVSKKK
ncbi:MAG: TfoX/Sxy family protein [Cyclobacteriaceae bacterium]